MIFIRLIKLLLFSQMIKTKDHLYLNLQNFILDTIQFQQMSNRHYLNIKISYLGLSMMSFNGSNPLVKIILLMKIVFGRIFVDGFRLIGFINDRRLIEYGIINNSHRQTMLNAIQLIRNEFLTKRRRSLI